MDSICNFTCIGRYQTTASTNRFLPPIFLNFLIYFYRSTRQIDFCSDTHCLGKASQSWFQDMPHLIGVNHCKPLRTSNPENRTRRQLETEWTGMPSSDQSHLRRQPAGTLANRNVEGRNESLGEPWTGHTIGSNKVCQTVVTGKIRARIRDPSCRRRSCQAVPIKRTCQPHTMPVSARES